MAELYDSALVRRAAAQIAGLSAVLEEDAAPGAQNAINESEALKGQAARALYERTEELSADIRRLCREMATISEALSRYAAALEEVSGQLTAQM